MANKSELQKQLNDLNNQINSTSDVNEKKRLENERDNVQRQLDQ